MANTIHCSECGAIIASNDTSGLCRRCLLALGLKVSVPSLESDLSPTVGGEAPRASSLSSHTPQRFGDYELLEEIARGGMGVVYKARQVSLNRVVAVKMILAGQFAGKQFVQRFRGEAAAAAVLQHPNIVAVHEVGVHEGHHFFSMDYVEGQNLSRLVGNQPFSAHKAARYVKLISEAIHYAHQQGILHRDLKPSNVLVDANDQPRVTDFGLARWLDGESTLTVTGQVLGSPNFMPPEQASADRGKVGRPSDVYGLGAILYYLLTARGPFQAESLEGIVTQVLHSEPVSPRLLVPGLPRDLETICLKCLQKEPPKRYATAQELADELDRFLRGEPILARPVTRAERAWRWCQRKPSLASFVAATALLLLAILIGSPIFAYRINQARKSEQAQLKRAEEESLKARQTAYASDMYVAHQAVKDGDLFRALEHLDRNRPSFGVPASAGSLGVPASGRTAEASTKQSPDRLKPGLQTDLRGWEWYYLWKQCQGDQLFTLGYHSNEVMTCGFLSDGKMAYSAGRDGSVRLWDFESRRQIGLLPHSEKVIGAAASPDGRWLAAATSTRAYKDPLCLWDLTTRQLVTVLTTNFWLRQSSITFSPDSRLLAFASNARVHLWDVNARSEITNLPATYQQTGPLGVAFSPDNRILAFNKDEYGTIVLWDIGRQSLAGRLHGHQSYVTALAFSPDGQALASGGQDRGVKLWNLAQRRERFTFTNHITEVEALAFSPDGRGLASAAQDGPIRLLSAETGLQTAELRGHRASITSVAFSPDGRMLLSASFDGTVRAWDAAPDQPERFSQVFAHDLERAVHSYGPALCLSPDGRHLLAAYTNGTFSVWDTLGLTESQRYPLCFTNTSVAALAPGGKLAGFSSYSGEVMLWDAQTGQIRFFARPESNRIHRLAFSFDGRHLAAANEKTIRVWNVGTQKETSTFSTEEEFAMSLAFSSNGEVLMAGFFRGPVKVWQVGGRSDAATFLGPDDQVRGLALLPDKQTLISAGPDIRFWDVRTRHENLKLRPRPAWFFCGALSPDGRRFAAGAGDGLITIWDVVSQQEVATLRGHKERVMHLAFTPDGDYLVSASRDQLRIWRAASHAEADSLNNSR